MDRPTTRKLVPTYCFQCVNGSDLLVAEVNDGVATEIQSNFKLKGEHPADGKVCVKPVGHSNDFVRQRSEPYRS